MLLDDAARLAEEASVPEALAIALAERALVAIARARPSHGPAN
jgi:hypothetical protein